MNHVQTGVELFKGIVAIIAAATNRPTEEVLAEMVKELQELRSNPPREMEIDIKRMREAYEAAYKKKLEENGE